MVVIVPDDPVDRAGVAEILQVKPNTVHGLMRRMAQRGHPAPDAVRIGTVDLWERAAIVAWAGSLPSRKVGNPNFIKGRQRHG